MEKNELATQTPSGSTAVASGGTAAAPLSSGNVPASSGAGPLSSGESRAPGNDSTFGGSVYGAAPSAMGRAPITTQSGQAAKSGTSTATLGQSSGRGWGLSPHIFDKSLLKWAWIAMAIQALLMLAYMAQFHGDPSSLVGVGRQSIGVVPFEDIHSAVPNGGLDGRYFYLLARDPWLAQGAELQSPTMRHARILYPALCWLLSFGGQPRLLFWVMPGVNLLAIGATAWLLAGLAKSCKMPPGWGCVVALSLGSSLGALFDLADPLSMALVVGTIVAWLEQSKNRNEESHWHWVGLWALLALLAREQNFLLVGALLAISVWYERHRTTASLTIAALVWGLWLAFVYHMYRDFAPADRVDFFGAPMNGYLGIFLRADPKSGPGLGTPYIICLLILAAQVGTAIFLAAGHGRRVTRALLVLGVVLVLCLGRPLLLNYGNFLRVSAILPLGIALSALQRKWRWPLILVAAGFIGSVSTVVAVWFNH